MAYGANATVTMMIGGVDTHVFTDANITIAVATADAYVDSINSKASATIKTEASNLIATEIMKHAGATGQLKGLGSDGGNTGRPAKSGGGFQIPVLARQMLMATPATSFTNTTPNLSGEI